jgi:hypothetical protein
MNTPVFILTAELDAACFAWLDALRREHFPPNRNLLPAHLTLFHRLSSAQTGRLANFQPPDSPVPVRFDAPILLGFGVAIRVVSPQLERLRFAVSECIGGDLSRQDSQSWRPHVTIQNKAKTDTARRLYQTLEHGFVPRSGIVTGLLVWEYLSGPWKLLQRVQFR